MSTSAQLDAFEQAKKNAPTHEAQILNVIRGLTHYGATKRELEHALSLKHQTTTARLSSLRDKGEIYLKETDEPKDGCTIWYATPEHLIKQKAKEQADAKFQIWLKRGVDKYNLSTELVGQIATEYNERNFDISLN